MFAFAACAAVAEARLPVDAQPTAFNLISLALETATPAGLSLNENVGFTESFLINKFFIPPICLASPFAFCKGVKPAFRSTMLFLSAIGNSSKYRQYVFTSLD